MGIQDINNFLANIHKHGDPAKVERFYVVINPPAGITGITNNLARDLTLQCEATELPGTTLEVSQYRSIGPAKKIAAMTAYNEITLSFFCTEDFYEKPIFDSWIEYINPRNLGWDFRYKDDYVGNIIIVQIDQSPNTKVLYATQLIKAFPTSTHPMSLNWSQMDTFHRLNVTFQYDRYQPIRTFHNMFANLLNNIGL